MALGLEKQLQRRTRTLAAVRRVLARCGYDQTSMKEIADEAGVTVPTLYNQFGSKDSLLAAAVEDLVRLQLDAVLRNEVCTGLARIVATALIPVNTMESDPEYAMALINGANSKDSKSARSISAAFHGFSELYLLGLQEMHSRGELVGWFAPQDVATSLRLHTAGAGRLWTVGLESPESVKHLTLLGTYLLLHSIAAGSMAEHLRGEIVRLQTFPPIGRTSLTAAPAEASAAS